MKRFIFLILFTSFNIIAQNIGITENTWYKVNSKGKFITKIKASGHYAVHEVVVHLVNDHWNTAEVEYISEFNYNHNRIKLEWGRIGNASERYITVRIVAVTADYATRFEFTDVTNPDYDYQLEAIDAAIVTPITPKKQLFVDEWTGNVGVGRSPSTNSSLKLSVNGGIRIGGANGIDNNSPALLLAENDDFLYDDQYINRYAFGFHNYQDPSSPANGANTYMAGYFGLDFFTASANRMRINHNGNVGIGTVEPDAKLTVKGNIHTQEVKVDLQGAVAPDYVFYENYNLKTLAEVEHYIKDNGHLPNIPSAEDMEVEGIKLKAMNLKLLEKIEELTLYTIQQEKKLNTQEAINKALQNRLLALEKLVLKTK